MENVVGSTPTMFNQKRKDVLGSMRKWLNATLFGECSHPKLARLKGVKRKSHGGVVPFIARKADGRWNLE